jgi:hypothetical protein
MENSRKGEFILICIKCVVTILKNYSCMYVIYSNFSLFGYFCIFFLLVVLIGIRYTAVVRHFEKKFYCYNDRNSNVVITLCS